MTRRAATRWGPCSRRATSQGQPAGVAVQAGLACTLGGRMLQVASWVVWREATPTRLCRATQTPPGRSFYGWHASAAPSARWAQRGTRAGSIRSSAWSVSTQTAPASAATPIMSASVAVPAVDAAGTVATRRLAVTSKRASPCPDENHTPPAPTAPRAANEPSAHGIVATTRPLRASRRWSWPSLATHTAPAPAARWPTPPAPPSGAPTGLRIVVTRLVWASIRNSPPSSLPTHTDGPSTSMSHSMPLETAVVATTRLRLGSIRGSQPWCWARPSPLVAQTAPAPLAIPPAPPLTGMRATTRLVAGSTRSTWASPKSTTHTASVVAATAIGLSWGLPTRIRAAIRLVAGSTRTSMPVSHPPTQTAPAATVTCEAAPPTAMVATTAVGGVAAEVGSVLAVVAVVATADGDGGTEGRSSAEITRPASIRARTSPTPTATVRAIRIRLPACCTPHPRTGRAHRPPIMRISERPRSCPPSPILQDDGLQRKVHAGCAPALPTVRCRSRLAAGRRCFKQRALVLAQPSRHHHQHHRCEQNL